jgi:hypothetical protein
LQGYEFGADGNGMTDVSLSIFPVEVQKRRIQMIDDKRPIDDGPQRIVPRDGLPLNITHLL